VRPGLSLALLGAALALAPAAARACGTINEEMRWEGADVVVDGTLVCPPRPAECRLRAREVLKPADRLGRRIFRVRIAYEAHERYRASNEISLCGHGWEPEQQRTTGRFFLSRGEAGGYVLSGWPELGNRRERD
jgi:hypothetical protein